jgi:hypothetical protein
VRRSRWVRFTFWESLHLLACVLASVTLLIGFFPVGYSDEAVWLGNLGAGMLGAELILLIAASLLRWGEAGIEVPEIFPLSGGRLRIAACLGVPLLLSTTIPTLIALRWPGGTLSPAWVVVTGVWIGVLWICLLAPAVVIYAVVTALRIKRDEARGD